MEKNTKHKKEKNILAFAAIYSVAMIFILVFTIYVLSSLNEKTVEITKYIVETEYVYISDSETSADSTEVESVAVAESVFETLIIKEHMGKIGIFNMEGEMVYNIDVYTKTLPQSDRNLLKEGFEITDKKQLYSIIQDYSS